MSVGLYSLPYLSSTQIIFVTLYRVPIKSFPDYKHLLQENYVEYKNIPLPLLKLVYKKLLELSYI